MSVKPRNTAVEAPDAFKRHIGSILRATAASAVCLYFEDRDAHNDTPLLLHAGPGSSIPELADPATAAATAATLAPVDGTRSEAQISIFPSEGPCACLLQITPFSDAPEPESGQLEFERRSAVTADYLPSSAPCLWVGLTFDCDDQAAKLRGIEVADAGDPQDWHGWLAHALMLVAGALWDTHRYGRLLRDPTSQLPGRAEFQAQLQNLFQIAVQSSEPLGLLLVNPDGFGAVNERLNRESGDRAVAEVAAMLRGSLRQDEKIYRYGGAVFAVLMPAADARGMEVLARKIRQSLSGAYLDGAVRLMFSVGAAVYQAGVEEDESLDDLGLVRRADHALNLAKRAGGGCSVLWSADQSELTDGGVDRLSGIFTANTEKDYRNMLLLWDTVGLLSSNTRKPEIVSEFVDRINVSLKPRRISLLERDADGNLRQVVAAQRSDVSGRATLKMTPAQQAMLEQAFGTLKSGTYAFEDKDPTEASPAEFVCHAIPIPANGECLACLYIDGPASRLRLDSSDLVFLAALAGQLGLALDRVALTEQVQREAEVESRKLREEVQDLRQALHSAKLVYRSKQMHAVIDTLRAVASTDVTILIDGESGTGKEMLARSVHELSERRDKPLVVVDCAAIAHNLLEAELFGYVKGAYTGAHGSSAGRIAQAEGGTLFLDEIGEVPLDVQAKLLRFVQEKEISAVGSTSSRQVDTRIVAATNRDLGREAAAGRFREDLYYRLKVVTVTAPPLRERPDDILPLAKHFLDKFALQYEKPVRRFEADTELYLQQHTWPGNVRELQNCILRAVVLCSGDAIPVSLLQVEDRQAALPVSAPEDKTAVAPPSPEFAPVSGDPWQALQEALVTQVDFALDDSLIEAVPLGRWLTEDLVREADRWARGNARRASTLLGIAQTTYRRQLKKLQRAQTQGVLMRTSNWEPTVDVVAHLIKSMRADGNDNVVEHAKNLLLTEVVGRVARKDSLGASLMGVTVPTYRRWKEDLLGLPEGADAVEVGGD